MRFLKAAVKKGRGMGLQASLQAPYASYDLVGIEFRIKQREYGGVQKFFFEIEIFFEEGFLNKLVFFQ